VGNLIGSMPALWFSNPTPGSAGAVRPEVVEATLWIPCAPVEEAAQLIWHARPVSYYAWSGHEQASNVTPKYWAAPCTRLNPRAP
jgi:hypothetical protein